MVLGSAWCWWMVAVSSWWWYSEKSGWGWVGGLVGFCFLVVVEFDLFCSWSLSGFLFWVLVFFMPLVFRKTRDMEFRKDIRL